MYCSVLDVCHFQCAIDALINCDLCVCFSEVLWCFDCLLFPVCYRCFDYLWFVCSSSQVYWNTFWLIVICMFVVSGVLWVWRTYKFAEKFNVLLVTVTQNNSIHCNTLRWVVDHWSEHKSPKYFLYCPTRWKFVMVFISSTDDIFIIIGNPHNHILLFSLSDCFTNKKLNKRKRKPKN